MESSSGTGSGADAASHRTASGHIPGLDGVRGISILAVIIAHVFERVPPGHGIENAVYRIGNTGWVGVDLFFVLSGFLITGILIDQRGSIGYFRTFYARRILRIVPAYVAFLLFSMWLAPLIGATSQDVARELRDTQGWYWAYLSNVWDILHPFPREGIPSHLWSLAIEEQFYLFWPLVVACVAPRTLPSITIACIVAAEICRIVVLAAGGESYVNYHLLPTRMDTIAVGAFLACAVRDPALLRGFLKVRPLVLGLAVALEAVSAFLNTRSGGSGAVTQLFGFPAIALLSGLLVFLVIQSQSLLTSRTLRFLGRYSYGMYIWHFVVLHVLMDRTKLLAPRRIGGSYLPYDALAIAEVLVGTVLVALVSWYVIEKPFLRLKRFVPYDAHPGTAVGEPAPA